jgi:hypothetical protein
VGSLALTGFAVGADAQVYLDDLSGGSCDSAVPYAGQDCDDDGVPDQCEPDRDGDEDIDDCDTCPDLPNPDQGDADEDGEVVAQPARYEPACAGGHGLDAGNVQVIVMVVGDDGERSLGNR